MNDVTKSNPKQETPAPKKLTRKTVTVQKGVATKARNAKVFENTEITTETDATGTTVSEKMSTSFEIVTSGGHVLPEHIATSQEAEAAATSFDDSLPQPPEPEPAPRTQSPRVPKRGM